MYKNSDLSVLPAYLCALLAILNFTASLPRVLLTGFGIYVFDDGDYCR